MITWKNKPLRRFPHTEEFQVYTFLLHTFRKRGKYNRNYQERQAFLINGVTSTGLLTQDRAVPRTPLEMSFFSCWRRVKRAVSYREPLAHWKKTIGPCTEKQFSIVCMCVYIYMHTHTYLFLSFFASLKLKTENKITNICITNS